MNSNQIKAFKKLVKDNGFTEVSNIVERQIGMNYGMFLSKCEVLFIFSRIRSCVHDEKLIALIDALHRQWLYLIVRNQWSPQFFQAYTKVGIEKAISQVLNLTIMGAWGFPGREQIDDRTDDHYACCDVIITGPDFSWSKPEETSESSSESSSELSSLSSSEEDVTSMSEQAIAANERIKQSLTGMIGDFNLVGRFFQLCSREGDLAYELDKANHQIEAMQRLSQRSDEDIDRLKSLLKDKEEAFAEATDEIKRLQSQLERHQSQLEQLQAQLQQASEAKPTAPTKKIIPESKLRELVAVGDKMIRQLTPFLAQYDIIVNPHK